MTDDRMRGRRRFLAGAVLAAGAAALACPRRQALAQTKKYTKERVGYRDEPYLGRTCSKCVLYAGHGECAIVEGEVSPDGWCLQWTSGTIGSRAGPA
jgi:High potential iron-sulfur protein